jgi:hypothetical protein
MLTSIQLIIGRKCIKLAQSAYQTRRIPSGANGVMRAAGIVSASWLKLTLRSGGTYVNA